MNHLRIIPLIFSIILGLMGAFTAPPEVPSAPPAPREDLSAWLDEACAEFKQPAIAAAVVRGGDIIALGAAGIPISNRIDTHIKADARFHIGSCTKSFTATLAAMLVHEGHLKWESTIVQVFPDLAGRIRPAYESVTLRQLLSHTAGIATYTAPRPEQMAKVAHLDDSPRRARRAFLEVVLNEDPLFTPGEGFAYSNAGYGVAAAMLEHIADTAWEELLTSRLFRPLGMKTAHPGWPNAKDAEQPWGHFADGETLTPLPPSFPYRLPAALDPAGDLSMSIEDFARWARVHLQGLRGDEAANELLPTEHFTTLHQPIRSNYALGFARANIAGELVSLHNGSAGSFFSLMTLLPKNNLAIVIITNAGSGEAACNELSRRLFERFRTNEGEAAE